MIDMTSNYLNCAGYDIHYTARGPQDAEPLIMWHGLARTGRDFDPVAAHFADRYRIICPDTIGRGLSEWARDEKDYGLEMYARIAVDLIDQLGMQNLRWLGTSMGGALGIKLAAGDLKGRITHLALNDFGPEPAATSVERIIEYVSNPPEFQTITELETYLRTIYKPYGYQTDAQWRHMTQTSARRKGNGTFTLHYDPRMIRQLIHHPSDYLMWEDYDRVEAKTLLLRGENSDLVPRQLAQDMTGRGPKCQVVETPNCGHAPALNVAEHYEILEMFFDNTP